MRNHCFPFVLELNSKRYAVFEISTKGNQSEVYLIKQVSRKNIFIQTILPQIQTFNIQGCKRYLKTI